MRIFLKENAPFWGPQIDPFWGPKDAPVLGVVFHGIIFKKNTNPEADPKTGQFVDPEMGAFFEIFAHFDAIFCGLSRLPFATDVVFLHAC